MNNSGVISQLQDVFDRLSPKLKKLATFIIENHKEAAFLNASSLARAASVSEATVTRLTYAINLKGYPELRNALQEHTKKYMSLPRYVPSPEGFILREVAAMEKSIIDEMLNTITIDQFKLATDTLYTARNIVIVGTRYNEIPASYATYFLSSIRTGVQMIRGANMTAFTAAQTLDNRDILLAISTARYPLATQKLIPMFKERGVNILAITDSPVAPIIPMAEQVLIVPMKFISFIDPFAGIMVLLHALVSSLYMKDKNRAKKWLKEFNVFMDHHDYHSVKGVDVSEFL